MQPSLTFQGFTAGLGQGELQGGGGPELAHEVQDMLAFLQLACFYMEFVHKLAEIARLLTDMLKSTKLGPSPKRPPWSWMRRLSLPLRT